MNVVKISNTVRPLDKKVMLVMPWMKVTNPMTAFCLMQLSDKRRTESMLNFGDAFVAHSRNTCADLFLGSDSDWMLTVDDDMLIPFGNARWYNAYSQFNVSEPFASFNAIDRLLSHGKTLVGGLYFGRWPKAPPVYNEGANAAEADFARKAPMDLCKPTRWVGTGCMMIHRSVFLDIEKKFPSLARNSTGRGGQWFTSSEHNLLDCASRTRDMLADGVMDGNKAMRAYEMLQGGLAESKANSSLGMGEDVQFCVRAKQAGHQPHVDLGLLCGHIGHCVYGPANTK